jgi:outer membrane lipoprotein LolB
MATERRRRLLIAALAIAGSGCASLPQVEPAARVHTGRFSASFSRGEQREAVSGRFTLAASPGRVTLDLDSPLGNTLARVEAVADRATLTAPQADGTFARWQGDSAEALAESVLGYRLPVSGLPDWIAGQPVPGRAARVIPDSGPAQRIEQDGWVIAIDERFEHGGAPRRLSLDRHDGGPTATSLRLRLVLDDPAGDAGATRQSRP